MGIRISALIQVYNEELCIGPCLSGLLPVVDECVIINGGPLGPSTDNTKKHIEAMFSEYRNKIVYIEETFIQTDGQWAHTKQNNLGIKMVSGDFLIRTHADLIYDVDDVAKVREAIHKFPNKKYFYAPMIDFFCSTEKILLPIYCEPEKQLGRPQCGDVVAINMLAEPKYIDFESDGGWLKSGLQLSLDWSKDTLYLPHVSRYHFAQVKPFKNQVDKMYRNLMRGHYEEAGELLKQKGDKAIYTWIVEQIILFGINPNMKDYAGDYPSVAESIRSMTYMSGYDEFMDWLSSKYGEL
jgi:glycosyltransferase involved in cell wall biosynthesis